jgi:hypothetical protein
MTPDQTPAATRRRIPAKATVAALAVGAAVFWGPAALVESRLVPGERFHVSIALFAILIPLSLFLVWRAYFDAPTRAERLRHWLRLAIAGPYLGAVLVGAITFFVGEEFERWRANPATPAASGVLLPLVLLTARPGMMLLRFSTFAAAAVVLVVTLFVPKGAHRSLD